MFKKLTCKIFLIATFLLVTLPMGAANIDGGGKIEKKVWQDSDPNNKENYFNNRRALVGPGCMINSLFDALKWFQEQKTFRTSAMMIWMIMLLFLLLLALPL